jgi:ribosomal protein L11 methylase PrmA
VIKKRLIVNFGVRVSGIISFFLFCQRGVEDMTFVDMGCNAGLFLGFAENKGFKKVIGIELDKKAVEKGKKNHNYDLRWDHIEESRAPPG